MRRRPGISPPSGPAKRASTDRKTLVRTHHAPVLTLQAAHHLARPSTQRPAMQLAQPHEHRFNQTPTVAASLVARRPPTGHRARTTARPSIGVMRSQPLAVSVCQSGATVHRRAPAHAIATARRRRSNRVTRVTRAIARPIARRSSQRRASRSAHPCGHKSGRRHDRRNARRSARLNRSAAMWLDRFATMTMTSAARSTTKRRQHPAAFACRNG
jgi:hypothetical protein